MKKLPWQQHASTLPRPRSARQSAAANLITSQQETITSQRHTFLCLETHQRGEIKSLLTCNHTFGLWLSLLYLQANTNLCTDQTDSGLHSKCVSKCSKCQLMNFVSDWHLHLLSPELMTPTTHTSITQSRSGVTCYHQLRIAPKQKLMRCCVSDKFSKYGTHFSQVNPVTPGLLLCPQM